MRSCQGMIERKSGGDPQCRLDRRLPARPRHGGLFRDQGLRPVVQRGAARGSEEARRCRHRALPGPDRDRVRRGRGLQGQQVHRASSSADSASVVAAGLEGLEQGRAIVIPGLMNKSTAQAHRFCPRSWMQADRRIDQALAVGLGQQSSVRASFSKAGCVADRIEVGIVQQPFALLAAGVLPTHLSSRSNARSDLAQLRPGAGGVVERVGVVGIDRQSARSSQAFASSASPMAASVAAPSCAGRELSGCWRSASSARFSPSRA